MPTPTISVRSGGSSSWSMATMLAPIIGGIAASNTVTCSTAPAIAEQAGEEEEDQRRGDGELEDQAGRERQRLAADLAEVELVADRDQRDRDEGRAKLLEAGRRATPGRRPGMRTSASTKAWNGVNSRIFRAMARALTAWPAE